MREFSVYEGLPPHHIEATAVLCGQDVSVCFVGGDTYHIGAVALGIPRPSLTGCSMPSASASVLCVTGHKDDDLARRGALELAAALGCRVSVTVGLHIDDATVEDIRLLGENFNRALTKIRQGLLSLGAQG